MHSVFNPHSPQGRAVATLWWAMFGVGSAVWISVIALMLAALVRRGRSAEPAKTGVEPPSARRAFVGWIAVAGVILSTFLVYDFALDRSLVKRAVPALTIVVTGHQWWWQVEYEDSIPSRRLITANEIHVPAGQLIRFKLRAADVIHSFWAPTLAGKRDLIPGYESSLSFRADTAGIYRGQCAEFCGLQHAQMAFYVVAQSPADFEAWRAATSAPSPPPTDPLASFGKSVFMSSGCALCHAIGGTDAWGTVGPTLSHIAARSTLAAGTLPNTRANLLAWIANPAAIKPGTHMPSSLLTGEELRGVVAYLETLR